MYHFEIKKLSDISLNDTKDFGAKSANLVVLLQKKLPVPDGFCIPYQAFIAFLRWNSLYEEALELLRVAYKDSDKDDIIDKALAFQKKILMAEHIPTMVEATEHFYRRIGLGVVAVRSSAVSEDSSKNSFAGQYESVLNIEGVKTLLHAIKEVWASYYSKRVILYRCALRSDFFNIDLAILVQKMVFPSSSGVMFTIDPVSGSTHDMLIEAGIGLGEAFVSGNLTPDAFWVSKPKFSWTGLGSPVIRHRRIVKKERFLKATARGTGLLSLEQIPSLNSNNQAIDDQTVEKLAWLGVNIEKKFAIPQDIEWAIGTTDGINEIITEGNTDSKSATNYSMPFSKKHNEKIYILQTRPITAFSKKTYKRPNTTLWTQRFSGERWTEPATRLGWSIIKPIIDDLVYFEDAQKSFFRGVEVTRLFYGYPYFNIQILRHLLWKLPGHAPPQFILEFFPKEEQDSILSSPYIIPDLKLIYNIFKQVFREKRWAKYHWNFFTNHRAWEEFLPKLILESDEMSKSLRYKSSNSIEYALKNLDKSKSLIVQYIKIHLLSLLFANLYYQLLAGLLRHWVREGGEALLSNLLADTHNNKTIQTNQAMWELSEIVKGLPSVYDWLIENETWNIEDIRCTKEGTIFYSAFLTFIDEYGHRAIASWEIFSPRWRDDYSIVFGIIKGMLKSNDLKEPIETAYRRMVLRDQSTVALLENAKGFNILRKLFLHHVLDQSQRYMLLRENQRFYFDKLLYCIKESLIFVGQKFADEGVLSHSSEISLFFIDEIYDYLNNKISKDDLKKLRKIRLEEDAKHREMRHPVFLEGDLGEFEIEAEVISNHMLSGLGISHGRVKGPACILYSLKDMHKLKHGDILVTRATDPGWTPLFLTLSGLVTELGGVLSHGAVVAREYQIPAVANIENATNLIKDGDIITVDGYRGNIYIHEKDA